MIPPSISLDLGAADLEEEADRAPACWGIVAVVTVALIALALAVLPAIVAAGAAPGVAENVAVALGGLAAGVGGVKLVAVAWGLVSRLAAESQGRRAAAVVD